MSKKTYYLKDLQPLINEVYPLIKWVQFHTNRGRKCWYETSALKELIDEYYFEN